MKKIIIAILLSVALSANTLPKHNNFGFKLNPTIPIFWGAIYSMGISYFDHYYGVEYSLPIFTSFVTMSDGDDWQSIHMDF